MPCPDDAHCGYPDQLEDKIERLEGNINDYTPEIENTSLRAKVERLEAEIKVFRNHELNRRKIGSLESAQKAVRRLQAQRSSLKAFVSKQAEDDGLWFDSEDIATAYIQQELRNLHREIEHGDSDGQG